MKIGVITTGRAELKGLHHALELLFPGHDFRPIPKIRPDTPYDGFTSAEIDPTTPVDLDSNAGRLVRAVAAALEGHDRVLLLDDLELVNAGRTAAVIRYLRDHVKEYIERFAREYGPMEARSLAEKLRQSASFHLAVPMIESWFFADPSALERMHVTVAPALEPGKDPEEFLTRDSAYDDDDLSGCTNWHAITDPKKKKSCSPEWDRDERQKHPKAYLAWLMKDPGDKRCSRYRETEHGVAALKDLDWQRALARPEHCAHLRAMVFDLSIALESPLSWLEDPARPASTEPKWPAGTLRNI